MGSLFARLAAQLPDAQLIGVADVDAGRADTIGNQLGVPSYQNYHDLLQQDTVETVVIATPDALHLHAAVAAARAGKHIFVEKPLATTVRDGEAIVEACDAGRVTLMVGHALRFDSHYGEAYRAIRNQRIGDVVHLTERRNTSIGDAERLRGRVSISFYLGSHSIDAIQWIMGSPIVEVMSSSVRKVMAQFDTDDAALSLVRFENGAIGMVENSYIRPNGAAARRMGSSLDIMGTCGSIHVETNTAGVTIYQPNLSEPLNPPYSFEKTVFGQISGVYRDEFAHFLNCIHQESPPIISPQQALSTVMVCEAIEQSLREHRPIAVNQQNSFL